MLLKGIGATLQLLRPLNLLLTAAGVFVGAVLASGGLQNALLSSASVLATMVSAVFIAAYANAINDVIDIDIDRINRPDRPVPSGQISPLVARRGAVLCGVAGLAMSLFLSPLHIGLALSSIGLAWIYSARLKTFGFVGNVAVSFLVAITLVYGALTIGSVGLAWIGFAAAFLMTLTRELVKDLEDIGGDSRHGLRTLPARIGSGNTGFVVVALCFLTTALLPVPFLWFAFSGHYLLIITPVALCLLGVGWIISFSNPEKSQYRRASNLLKAAMTLGLFGLTIGV